MKLSMTVQQLLRCPACRKKMKILDEQCKCADPGCGAAFPVTGGIPILLNEDRSLFSIDAITHQYDAFLESFRKGRAIEKLKSLMPDISNNIKAKQNYAKFAGLLCRQSPAPKVLVLGGRILGKGMESLLSSAAIELVESDISWGPRTMLICDAHDIPFEDDSFDGVIIQAVLEHVVDPHRCVGEVHRVLKQDGLIYSETPFMQQVHGGRYDFTRFTYLGQRRLFREFEELESGAMCGPGMALAWAYTHFLLSFASSGVARNIIKAFSRLTSFYLKYFDYYLINRAEALDAASGYYFMGKKSREVLSDKELIKLYKGAAD